MSPRFWQLAQSVFKVCASIKLSVIVISGMAIISAWGTIVESRYDARTARELVYFSPFMYAIMIFLAINLIFAMVDRYPFKKRHIPFVLAHIGILLLILGSQITREFGIDGSMSLKFGETKNWLTIPDTYLRIYHSVDGSAFTPKPLFDKKVNLITENIDADPLEVRADGQDFRFDSYYPYALRSSKIVPSESPMAGPAVRFALQNKFTSTSEWLVVEGNNVDFKNMGPLRLVLFRDNWISSSGNEIVLQPKDNDRLNYMIQTKDKSSKKNGSIAPGESLVTPWMDMTFRVLKYLPKAESLMMFEPQKRPTELSTEAVRVDFMGEKKWVGLNSYVRLPAEKGFYIVAYTNEKIGIGFDLKLDNFSVGRYQGTMMAASYESDVIVESEKIKISMNEPLKKNGFTFYQASFQEDERGKPVVSILSVNYDPGRFLKYLGSTILVLGIMWLFYGRNKSRRSLLKKEMRG